MLFFSSCVRRPLQTNYLLKLGTCSYPCMRQRSLYAALKSHNFAALSASSPFVNQKRFVNGQPPPQSGGGKDRNEIGFTWRSFFISMGAGGILLYWLHYLKQQKELEKEKKRRQMLGKAKIGGRWDLVNMHGKPQKSEDYHGQWLLIYFGFTHCPDICPDEIEKMCLVSDTLDKNPNTPPVKPIFFTVDQERDDPEAVKKYCEEFSPKLLGFTGTQEQVESVCKAFRVYHTQGPKDEDNDYIVDHTVIMYLVDPEGQFVDYYGQNRTATQVVSAIELEQFKYQKGKMKGLW